MSYARISKRVDGNKLRQIRESIGWTQQHAAMRSGYSCRLIRKLESGGPVDQKTLRDVIDAYREHDSMIEIGEYDRYLDPELAQAIVPLGKAWLRSMHAENGFGGDAGVLSPTVVLSAEGQHFQGEQDLRKYFARKLSAIGPVQFQINQIIADSAAVSVYWTLTCVDDCEVKTDSTAKASRFIRGSTLLLFRDRQIVMVREHSDQPHQE